MSSPLELVEGQLDNAVEEVRAGDNSRQGGHYVDDDGQWSSDDDDEDIDFELSGDDFENDRVEDEDWEIAERGMYH